MRNKVIPQTEAIGKAEDCLRGRDAGSPAPPAQTRTCSFPASGSSGGLAAAQDVLSSNHASTPHLGEAGPLDVVGVQDLGEAPPADAPAFPASPIEPREGTWHGPVTEAIEGASVAMNPIVALMSPEPSLEAVEAGWTWHMPVRLNPFLDPLARTLPFLASGAACDTRHSLSVFCPETFEAHKGEPPRHARMKATAAQDTGLLP